MKGYHQHDPKQVRAFKAAILESLFSKIPQSNLQEQSFVFSSA